MTIIPGILPSGVIALLYPQNCKDCTGMEHGGLLPFTWGIAAATNAVWRRRPVRQGNVVVLSDDLRLLELGQEYERSHQMRTRGLTFVECYDLTTTTDWLISVSELLSLMEDTREPPMLVVLDQPMHADVPAWTERFWLAVRGLQAAVGRRGSIVVVVREGATVPKNLHDIVDVVLVSNVCPDGLHDVFSTIGPSRN